MRSKNPTFPILITLFSLVVLYRFMSHPADVYGLISILVGLAGIVLYYKGRYSYDRFFYAWVFMQLPDIYLTSAGGIETPIANAFPVSYLAFNLGVGLNLGLHGGSALTVYFNALPIGLYFLLKYQTAEKPLGARLSIGRLRKGAFPHIQFPVAGVVEQISGRNKLTAVYQLRLDEAVQIRDKSYFCLLLEPKNDTLIQPIRKKQVCGLRLCETPGEAYNDQRNPFVDWVTVEASE